MNKTAIMQSYFLPYIGYWQLINAVDTFVVYDNIEFTKKGWFNRNRILEQGHDRLFTIPVKKDSDYLPVNRRYISDDGQKEIARTMRIIEASYKKAPYYSEVYSVLDACFLFPEKNLFAYIFNSIQQVCNYLGIDTQIIVSSKVDIDHSLKAQSKVIAICQALNTGTYINPVGGTALYDKAEFQSHGVDLKFIKSKEIEYAQFDSPFVPWLSIIDVMMFNDKARVKQMLEEYVIV